MPAVPLRPRPRAAQSAAGPSQPAGAIDRGSRPDGPGAAPAYVPPMGARAARPFLGTSTASLWHSVCAFNVQGGAEHGHFDAAAVFRAAPAATFPIVAAVGAAAERAAERAAATKASAAVQAGAVTLAAQETGRQAAPALALALELARHSTAFSDLFVWMGPRACLRLSTQYCHKRNTRAAATIAGVLWSCPLLRATPPWNTSSGCRRNE